METAHDFTYAADTGILEYIFVTVLDILFGAGTFMFCMGFGIAYSKRTSPEYLMKRGIHLFLLGYLLNLAQNILYLFFVPFPEWLSYVFTLDILQFAGLALFLFGLLKKGGLSDWAICAAALVMSVIGSFVGTIVFHNNPATLSVGLFFGTMNLDDAYAAAVFPLFNWFIFVAMGNLFGSYLRRCADKKKFYLLLAAVCAPILAVYMLIAIPARSGMMGSIWAYYHLNTPNALICMCGAVTALSLYCALSRILPGFIRKIVQNMSLNINRIYCLQWVIITWTWSIVEYFEGDLDPSDGVLVLCGLAVAAICALLAEAIRRSRMKKAEAKPE